MIKRGRSGGPIRHQDETRERGGRWRTPGSRERRPSGSRSSACAIAFAVAQLPFTRTHLGLSYYAESNPVLVLFRDVVDHKVYEFVLKVALVGFVIWVARLQRRRAIGLALLLLGTIAGVLGALSNVNAWTYL